MVSYIFANLGLIFKLVGQHLAISGAALAISLMIALPLGYFVYLHPRIATPVMGVLGALYTIPSIALIILLIPLFGLDATSVVVALVIYTQVILVRNIVTGLSGIDPTILETAQAMGMDHYQIAWRVQLPLALPLILAGLRIGAVVAIGIAAIGAKFSAGGLGVLLFEGIAEAGRMDKIWAGAILVGLLALGINELLRWLERRTLRWAS